MDKKECHSMLKGRKTKLSTRAKVSTRTKVSTRAKVSLRAKVSPVLF